MRHKKTEKRIIEPDKIYKNRLVAIFINKIMKDGKKTTAEKVFYGSLEKIKQQQKNPVDVFELAIQNVGPKIEVKPRRVGGASYQVPAEVRGDRRVSLAMRWIIAAAKARSSKDYRGFGEKLAAEFLDASQNLGAAIKKRDVVQKQAEANKAFAHFRW
ncbi:MAG: 30S ribosomal protein S7 [Patescibacteria group bacterium]|nr:30S ribosomal protein S7 [Patescibacteria group bacterium]